MIRSIRFVLVKGSESDIYLNKLYEEKRFHRNFDMVVENKRIVGNVFINKFSEKEGNAYDIRFIKIVKEMSL